jgi:hypothetical protein
MKKWILLPLLVSSTIIYGQKNFHPFIAGGLALDAEAIYFGPTIIGGANYDFKIIQVEAFAQSFKAKTGKHIIDYNGTLLISTVGFGLQKYLLSKNNTKLYFGLGICYQLYNEKGSDITGPFNESRKTLLPRFKTGYSFRHQPKKPQFSFELAGTGPYIEIISNVSSHTEILTLVSLSLKLSL